MANPRSTAESGPHPVAGPHFKPGMRSKRRYRAGVHQQLVDAGPVADSGPLSDPRNRGHPRPKNGRKKPQPSSMKRVFSYMPKQLYITHRSRSL